METRPMKLEIDFLDDGLTGKALPYDVEIELPSGQIASADLVPFEDLEIGLPSAFDRWTFAGQKCHGIVVPEAENIIGKLQMRFVPKIN